jgi:branched-chain amino acid transport system substrate-binding protein
MRLARISRVSRGRRGFVLVALAGLALAVTAVAGLSAVQSRGPVLNYSAYVSGSGKANPKLPPVVIGWINGQGGTVPGTSFPSTTRGAEAVVKMINNELGGVWGHPVKLDECFIVSAEEEGTKCGQQMANDKKVKIVAHGVVVVGNQSEYNVLKGSKPVVMGVSASNADVNAKNAFALIGTSISVLSPFGPYTKKVYPNAKTAAIVYPNQAGSDVAANSLKKSYESVGIKATLIAHDPTASDLVGVATQANGYDVVVASCNFGDCALLAKGLAAIGSKKPVVTPPLAIFIPFPAYPGGDFPHWDVGVAQSFLFDPSDPEIKLFTKKAAQYGLSAADQKDVFAELSWTTMLAITKIMNTIPYAKLNSAAITAGFRSFRGPLVMGAPDVGCGTVDKTQPAACANEAQFYQYQGGGKWKKTSGYIGPAKKK